MLNDKKQKGQFFTKKNPFLLKPFRDWINAIPNIENLSFVEPFAGENNLLTMIDDIGVNVKKWTCFDIDPKLENIQYNDSLKEIPGNYDVCITNPPYLARYSASRLHLSYPDIKHDDVYKHAIEKCLEKCTYVAAIIPESFITSKLFYTELDCVISINFEIFDDTSTPVCLALFSKKDNKNKNFDIWKGEEYIGSYEDISKYLPNRSNSKICVKFNDENGILGMIAIDSNNKAGIKFVKAEEITATIKVSTRTFSKISFDAETTKLINKIGIDKFIQEMNSNIDEFRNKTKDIFLTAFKSLRKDGCYRRRLDFNIAKTLLIDGIMNLSKTNIDELMSYD